MGIAERKEREKERRRQEIIDAAERVFFSKGIQNATMDDVAQEAELSKGTLYLYFNSKIELYLAINIRGVEILNEIFLKAFDSVETGLQKTYALGRAFLEFANGYPDYYNALSYYEFYELELDSDSQTTQMCAKSGHAVLEKVIDALRLGIEDGSVKPDIDPVLTANILWAQSSGMIQFATEKKHHLEQDHGISVDDFIDYYFKMIGCSIENR